MALKFGPAGNSNSFYDEGYKSSIDMPEWLNRIGLDAYEYSCTRGVNISLENARAIGINASRFGIEMSVHAPYYINFGSYDSSILQKSKKYIIDSVKVAAEMKADRVVFHPGSCGKVDRKKVFDNVKAAVYDVIDELVKLNLYPGVTICPETMGKANQLGILSEVLELCKLDENIIPTIDFGHIHAIGIGALNSEKDFDEVLEKIIDVLGDERGRKIHSHFSKIEYTQAGEKKHWTFEDTQFGPEFEHLVPCLVKRNIDGRIICESRGTMAEDALKMKKIYKNIIDNSCLNI